MSIRWNQVSCVVVGLALASGGCASNKSGTPGKPDVVAAPGSTTLASLDAAAALALSAAKSEDAALGQLPSVAPTAAQLGVICPGMAIPHQVAPAEVMRYIVDQCPKEAGSYCEDRITPDEATFEYVPVAAEVWQGGACPEVKVWRLKMTAPYSCGRLDGCEDEAAHDAECESCSEDADADCSEACGVCGWGEFYTYFVDDVFAVQHPGGFSLVWAAEGYDPAQIGKKPVAGDLSLEGPDGALQNYNYDTETHEEVFFCGEWRHSQT